MDFLLYCKKNHCDVCHQVFDRHDDLLKHAKEDHHKPIIKCHNCKMESLHEKDRLHHVQEEEKKKIDYVDIHRISFSFKC